MVDLGSLDLLRPAVDAVIARFKKERGRNPTKEEWEGLLTAALDRDEVGVMISVKLDLANDDELDDDAALD